uniref:Predicted protein n=1 Tax=Physcomitrium patens TaxID=3218 RepID=A9U533_PHYPA
MVEAGSAFPQMESDEATISSGKPLPKLNAARPRARRRCMQQPPTESKTICRLHHILHSPRPVLVSRHASISLSNVEAFASVAKLLLPLSRVAAACGSSMLAFSLNVRLELWVLLLPGFRFERWVQRWWKCGLVGGEIAEGLHFTFGLMKGQLHVCATTEMCRVCLGLRTPRMELWRLDAQSREETAIAR